MTGLPGSMTDLFVATGALLWLLSSVFVVPLDAGFRQARRIIRGTSKLMSDAEMMTNPDGAPLAIV
jgi:hypothetical protein